VPKRKTKTKTVSFDNSYQITSQEQLEKMPLIKKINMNFEAFCFRYLRTLLTNFFEEEKLYQWSYSSGQDSYLFLARK
jgi:hypothetical protein